MLIDADLARGSIRAVRAAVWPLPRVSPHVAFVVEPLERTVVAEGAFVTSHFSGASFYHDLSPAFSARSLVNFISKGLGEERTSEVVLIFQWVIMMMI